MGAKHVKYKNYYLKTSFMFNFLKIVFILFWKKKKKNHPTNQTHIYGESFVHWRRKWGIKGAIIMALNPKSFNQEIHTKSSRPEIKHIFSIIVKKGRHICRVFFHWRREKGRPKVAPYHSKIEKV